MARTKFKCEIVFCSIFLFSTFVTSLPILRSSTVETTESFYNAAPQDELLLDKENSIPVESKTVESTVKTSRINGTEGQKSSRNATDRSLPLSNLREGQTVRSYAVEITRDGDRFRGRAVIDVRLTDETRDDPIRFDSVDLNIDRVLVGVLTDANAIETDFDTGDDNEFLEIFPEQLALSYIVIIEYSAPFGNGGLGLFMGQADNVDYIGMNLHPTGARRVFPCSDEPNLLAFTTFTFTDMGYNNMVANSLVDADNQNTFRTLEGPVHLWGMVAHNFNTINIPTQNVLIYARPGIVAQDSQAALAINHYFNGLNEWTNKPYQEIIANQDGRMHVMALPDVARDWYALSTVCIWEPYMLMENNNAVRQRKTAFLTIAESMARQWFGYVIFPENWSHQWMIEGLSTYVAYEIARDFQTDPNGVDQTLLDMNTIFTADVIQQSLLEDAYRNSALLAPEDDIFDENEIRLHMKGVLKYKAAAILRMLRIVGGDADTDIIQNAAQILLQSRALQPVNSQIFYDALNSAYSAHGTGLIEDVNGYLEPWVTTNTYPLISVGMRLGGVIITQEVFSFSPTTEQTIYMVPLTHTTSLNPNFDDVHPNVMMDMTTTLSFPLDEEDWVILNIQGQGYYRVNYDLDLWERLIMALEDPERREEIHPLNRATLVDDALNLARAGKIDYDIAFRVVLTMEHETEYPVWRAFVRNMDFIRKWIVPHVLDDDDLDDDIYLRMVRRTVITLEDELGFTPDNTILEPAMDSLTRGLVMEHACRAGYDPCIAAAVDWFYDGNNNGAVNPDIPPEIRPAVYCTMVREGDDDVISALYDRMEIEASRYERLVILESLACSENQNFINTYLQETIADNSPYVTEERSKIFKAVASSNTDNAQLALRFITQRTNEIRDAYGGADKLEEIIFELADNMATSDLAMDFTNWVNSILSNLEDSDIVAQHLGERIAENLAWSENNLEAIYEWIDENDAPTLLVSSFLITLAFIITLFNN